MGMRSKTKHIKKRRKEMKEREEKHLTKINSWL